MTPTVIVNSQSQTCCTSEWEAAYVRFESPAQEIAKFKQRLQRLGQAKWPRDSRIVELCCGRGNGLVALHELGFSQLHGVDLSATLIERYEGPATCHVADCRQMPFADQSLDIVIVQGGLHHLPNLPDDLEQTLREAHRVLVPGGQIVIVEPWRTSFLDVVHAACRNRLLRKIWPKLDALATMIDHEIETYSRWLSLPDPILASLEKFFPSQVKRIGWGKLEYVGRRGI